MSQQDEGDDLLWDPIDDAVEYDRGNFVELIKHFLWRENAPSTKMNVLNDTAAKTNGSITLYGTAAIVEGPGLVTARKDLKSSKKKSKIKSTTSKADDVPTDISESKSDMRRRLKEGSEYQQQDEPGLWLEISIADLRDLCLQMEKPDLQDIHDACADFGRGAEEADDVDVEAGDEDDSPTRKEEDRLAAHSAILGVVSQSSGCQIRRRTYRPRRRWDKEATFIDFGDLEDDRQYVSRKMRIKVCGRSIYNYRSERAMNHTAWYHFSIIPKDSNLFDAIKLCRNWGSSST
ncbi:hypothetical protein MMC13_004415 [Lambiella insularis]|nr:hypothetical protein [Lambiella insularis]